mmetsp:Transcript_4176/g.10735  ORF Transcript_4176/g.10735 Transcript_4176/m.10735 type:complete len:200 (+) Transcript_4176:1028-1627(+)
MASVSEARQSSARLSVRDRSDGAMTADAMLCTTLTPMSLLKARASCWSTRSTERPLRLAMRSCSAVRSNSTAAMLASCHGCECAARWRRTGPASVPPSRRRPSRERPTAAGSDAISSKLRKPPGGGGGCGSARANTCQSTCFPERSLSRSAALSEALSGAALGLPAAAAAAAWLAASWERSPGCTDQPPLPSRASTRSW